MTNVWDRLAKGVRQHRARLGISQEDLARRADLNRTYISGIENGKATASVDVLDRLSRALDVTPNDLLDYE